MSNTEQSQRELFEKALAQNPDARFWNTTDAMFWAWLAALSAQSAAQEPVLKGWEIELKANGDWHVVSPSGDSAHVFHDDESPLGEVSRQLMQSISFGVNCAGHSTHQSSAAQASDWQSMEIAPLGKTLLLRCENINHEGIGYVCIGHYIEPFTEENNDSDSENVDYSEEKDAWFVKPGWYEHQYNWGDYSSIAIHDKVIGWMPAPSFKGEKQNG